MAGSYGRWSFFADEARSVARRLEHEAFERERVLAKIDIRLARRCTELAARATELAVAFEDWSRTDPGQDARHGQIAQLFDIRAQAEHLAPLTPT